ncbi:hypothetical protein ISG33_12745 [Glaciecola sp. MH2013]|uniref:hypothetical protein n=1 Tax=Glaciecola sp. MH2013 TaxID=2785524 RepID=UPI00189E93B8|nr:hypothetical protein [Glaciecola sp. MH2013]MBF7074267.1 hypothetical protein [Glaciecola sp. MH2013]
MNYRQIISTFKREIWEYKRTFVMAPLIISGLLLSMILLELVTLDSHQVDNIGKLLDATQNAEGINAIEKSSYAAVSGVFVIFLIIAGFVQLKYFLSCLYDERRDKSIYFWRSLPVSDLQNVVVKFITGAFIVPIAFIISATVFATLAFIIFIVGVGIMGAGGEGSLWDFIVTFELFSPLWLVLLALVPVVLWLFPLFAWLMLASMIAERAAFLWAVFPVVVLLLGEVILVKGFNSGSFYFVYLLRDYFAFSPTDPELAQLAVHFGVSSSPYFLSQAVLTKVGVAPLTLGVILMGATYWLRVKRSHV